MDAKICKKLKDGYGICQNECYFTGSALKVCGDHEPYKGNSLDPKDFFSGVHIMHENPKRTKWWEEVRKRAYTEIPFDMPGYRAWRTTVEQMDPDLVINGIDFNQRIEQAKAKIRMEITVNAWLIKANHVYPFVGWISAPPKFNFKDPRDHDKSLFRIVGSIQK